MRNSQVVCLVLAVTTITSLVTGCGAEERRDPRHSVVRIDRVTVLPPKARPSALALADDGALWVAEDSISAIARIGPHAAVTQYRIPGQSNNPDEILRGPDGNMWFRGFEVIGIVHEDTGQLTGWQTGNQVDFGLPESFTVGPDGAVWYVNSAGQSRISRIDRSNVISTVANLPVGGVVGMAGSDITTGPDDAAWITQIDTGSGSDAIIRVGADGGVKLRKLPRNTLPGPIVSGRDKALWFGERTGMGRITVAGKVSHFKVREGQRPNGVAAAPDGSIWFTTDKQLGKIDPSGSVSLYSIPKADELVAIVPAESGGFWVSDVGTDVVEHVVVG